jgi:hypothetical protein
LNPPKDVLLGSLGDLPRIATRLNFSMFAVVGVLDGLPYEVEVTGNPAAPVVGNARVARLLVQFQGETCLATPVGPAYLVDPADPLSVLALLCEASQVLWVSENAPSLIDPRQLGTVW